MSLAASIVITNFNYEEFLGAAIESALGQSVTVQVIVVDDGSSDGSLEVARRYEPGVTVRAQINGGQASAFNEGFKLVAAPIVIFLDADDLIDSDLVERLIPAFAAPEVVRVHYPLRVVDRDGRPTGDSIPPEGTRLSDGDRRRDLLRFPDDLSWQPTSGNAFSTDVLREVLPMPTDGYRICADYYLLNLTAAHGSVFSLAAAGGSYRVHAANGHYATSWTLKQVREHIIRTRLTHRLLADHVNSNRAASLCRADSASVTANGMHSVTLAAHEMMSVRFDPERHPVPGASRWAVAAEGCRAVFGRDGLRWWRRATMVAWFCGMSVVPRRMLGRLSTAFLTVDTTA